MDRVSNESLLEAGLALMKQAGSPLERVATGTRAMVFKRGDGQSVRVRTCNDHVLVVVAESVKPNAKLNIQGTDYLLVVMPEVPRVNGPVIAYLVPTSIAIKDVRKAHEAWVASGPRTRGQNTTWNIWFGDSGKSGGFARHWAKYRLPGVTSTKASGQGGAGREGGQPAGILGQVIAQARRTIAEAAGVEVEAVKISLELA